MGRSKRVKVDRGIYRDDTGYTAVVANGPLPPAEKRFPLSTPKDRMRQWRHETEAQRGRMAPAAGKDTLRADIQKYLHKKRTLPAASLKDYRTQLAAWPEAFQARPRARITKDMVEEQINVWVMDEGVARSTVRYRLGLLQRLYTTLDGSRKAWTPCDGVDFKVGRRPGPKPVVYAATVQAVYAQLVEHERRGWLRDAKTRARFMIRACSGVRPIEIMRAKPEHLDFEKGWWHTVDAKGGNRGGGLALTPDLRAAWQLFIAADAWGPFRTHGQAQVLRNCGWPEGLRPYAMRGSFGRWLAEAGVDAAQVSTVLGHCSLDMTRGHYVDPVNAQTTIAMEKVGTVCAFDGATPTARTSKWAGRPSRAKVATGRPQGPDSPASEADLAPSLAPSLGTVENTLNH